MAGLTLSQLVNYTSTGSQTSQYVGGVFNKYTAYEFLLPYSGPVMGGCRVMQETTPTGGKEPSAADAQLDAGVLKFSGPGITSQTVGVIQGPVGPIYNSALAASAIQGGATYTLTGAGGTQVGPFTATGTFPASFTSNLSTLTSVNHAQPLTITWSGSGFDVANILIIGSTSVSGGTLGATVSCVVPATPGTFTIPAAAQAYLPSSGTWQIELTAEPNPGGPISSESAMGTQLTPPLVSGGQMDFGGFGGSITHIVGATVK